jgi:hypothetical protein
MSLQTRPNGLSREEMLALRGLRLPRLGMKRLRSAGIYCEPAISIEQERANQRYLLRGVESGGAIPKLGLYAGYSAIDGSPIEWLHRVDALAPNGTHAIVVAPQLARIQIFRVEFTYQLLITSHRLKTAEGKQRPALESAIIFHAAQGRLALELWRKDSKFIDLVEPVFYTRAGEVLPVPDPFQEIVRRVTCAVCCLGCKSPHLLEAPRAK